MPPRAPTTDDPRMVFWNRRATPPFTALRAFAAVGEFGGIRKAAAVLELDHAAVSRHLRSLEVWAGVPLVERGVNGGKLTPDGAKFHARITAALHDIAAASADLLGAADEPTLQISCIPGLASNWLLGRLSDFRQAHPEIQLVLRPSDTAPDFTRRDMDADIRYVIDAAPDRPPAGEIETVQLGRPPVLAVASPARLDILGEPQTAADLLKGPLLHEENARQWTAWFLANGVSVGPDLSGHKLWQAHLAVDAARRGEGLALANAFLVGDDFKAGRLVDLGARVGAQPIVMGAYVFSARRDRWRTPALLAFRRWLVKEAAAEAARW
ncbi:LysR substrate-binding domain-containing protein [Caulobacter sp. RHG1]|uniref:LysR substrate-binding domain-containing protein n=1 Tax=Caulobacter sp. (strain RHG1) TaxID=2545762 RepID=UPI0015561E33|nr:LysR substrate-binding domain-containing protein [Caulobacter sp. RHG1]NQE62799.1 hypothetical protein [Caulobacter sp. RHG1]